jgi:hypothetical protein
MKFLPTFSLKEDCRKIFQSKLNHFFEIINILITYIIVLSHEQLSIKNWRKFHINYVTLYAQASKHNFFVFSKSKIENVKEWSQKIQFPDYFFRCNSQILGTGSKQTNFPVESFSGWKSGFVGVLKNQEKNARF